MEKIKYSFVIPCYKSEGSIKQIVDNIIISANKLNIEHYEVILVNDGSPDDTWKILKNMADNNINIKAINFSRNFGQHAAIMAGFRASQGEYIVGLDDDGEHDPEDVIRLIKEINNGYDYVCGRYTHKKNSVFRNLGTVINNMMTSALIGKPNGIDLSSYYIMRRFLVNEIIKYDGPYPYVAGLMLRATRNISAVEMPKHERVSGKSGYNFIKLLKLWLNGFTAFSVKPLRISTILGAVCALIGFVFGIITIINKLIKPEILVGYSSLMAVLLFVGGMIMMMLGMLGEYVGRIYLCINNSPQYVIRDTINIRVDDEKEI